MLFARTSLPWRLVVATIDSIALILAGLVIDAALLDRPTLG
ncbi:hypothetical protein [Pseudarthrobacter sp. L1SW]|nr:hypothetical protein [Pseudarthrobacter sp. L1SW]